MLFYYAAFTLYADYFHIDAYFAAAHAYYAAVWCWCFIFSLILIFAMMPAGRWWRAPRGTMPGDTHIAVLRASSVLIRYVDARHVLCRAHVAREQSALPRGIQAAQQYVAASCGTCWRELSRDGAMAQRVIWCHKSRRGAARYVTRCAALQSACWSGAREYVTLGMARAFARAMRTCWYASAPSRIYTIRVFLFIIDYDIFIILTLFISSLIFIIFLFSLHSLIGCHCNSIRVTIISSLTQPLDNIGHYIHYQTHYATGFLLFSLYHWWLSCIDISSLIFIFR